MKTILKVSTILSWVNLVIGGILVAGGLLTMLVIPNAMMILLSVVLTGSVVLHSYAALQLRKSILYPEIPLNSQTPTGIKFIGFLALFFAVLNISNSIIIIQNAGEAIKQAPIPANFPKEINLVALVRGAGVFSLLFGVGIAVNVFLSMKLLRWYLSSKQE